MSLLSVLRPSSIAVVGASPRSFIGRIALRNCTQMRFRGELYAVNPAYLEVEGVHSVPDLQALPVVPDLALVQLRTDRVAAVIEAGAHLGIKGFVIPGAGHTDSGAAAADLTVRLRELRARFDFDIVGPNCMGVADLVTGATPYVGTVPPSARRGTVGVVAQSGAIVEAVVNSGGRIPISTAVSSGSEATTSLSQILDFFVQDPETTAVLALVEVVGDAGSTLAAARRLADSGKPLAVCVVGRSATARDGIAAHSGKLASAARVTAAAFRQVGALIADDLDELLGFGELFATRRTLPGGPVIHVVTNSGGEANLIADIAEDAGLTLPPFSPEASEGLRQHWPQFHVRNPLDPWGADDYQVIYPHALRAAAADEGDAVVIAIDQQQTSGEHEVRLGLDLADYLASVEREPPRNTNWFPVMLSPTSQDPDPRLLEQCQHHRIALLRGARTGLTVLAKAARRRHPQPVPVLDADSVPPLPPIDAEDAVLSTLAAMGVRVPRCVRVTGAREAAEAADEFPGPVVVKGTAPGLLHKTELGLVCPGLAGPDAVHREAARMLDWARRTNTDLELLVAEMVRGDLELIIGYKNDPVFGPTTLVGLGGIWTEFFNEVSVHVGPLDRAGAANLLATSRVGQMLASSRSGQAEVEGVITALCAVAQLGSAYPEIRTIDVNPLIVGRDHATAVDAAIERTPNP